MSSKKVIKHVVTFVVTTEVNVEIPSTTFEEALEIGRKFKHSDLLKVTNRVTDIVDYKTVIGMVWNPEANR